MKNIKRSVYIFLSLITTFTYSAENPPITTVITFNELVSPTDLIVIGEIEGIVTEGIFYGYDNDGRLINPIDEDPDLGLPAIDFTIYVDEVLADPNNIYKGGNLTLRLMGETDDPNYEKFYTSLLGKTVFFLGQNPDKNSYGFSHYKKMIHIDKSKPYYPDFNGEGEFYLSEQGSLLDVTTEEFLAKLLKNIEE